MSKRLRILNFGRKSLTLAAVIWIAMFIMMVYLTGFPIDNQMIEKYVIEEPLKFGLSMILAALLFLLLWMVGIICVYTTSIQLGIRWRIIGAISLWIPFANIFMIYKIISLTRGEFLVEKERIEIDKARAENEICKTKYPILLVHGVFFRDSNFFNYWGRIPKALIKNGAVLFYGEQESAASVEASGKELADKIKEVLKKTGSEKVNIIAHSKGGLDSRYAISLCEMENQVASLTTINTPHRGCIFAQYLLDIIPEMAQRRLSSGYNKTLRKLGDNNPDFMSAVMDLTADRCADFNEKVIDSKCVYYQSYMSKMNKASSGRFPLNVSYPLVKKFDYDNDGLVAVTSAKWGDKFTMINPTGRRGISHGDMIDLNRENIDGFDVREIYIEIVKGLKEKGF